MIRLPQIIRRSALHGTCVLAATLVIGPPVLDRALPFPFLQLDRMPLSTRVTDRHGNAMLELVGSDEQYRLPVSLKMMSPRLMQATVAAEDARFYDHHGVDPRSVLRAMRQNATSGRIVSGASTISMQLCRMMDNRPRTWGAKAIETCRALQLEHHWDKDRILHAYLNLAPYGLNLRGVEAASRHWFGRRAADLSLAEAALLSGLPQSPSRLRPDRHPEAALARRNYVLGRMLINDMITRQEHDRAAASSISLRRTGPGSPAAPHAGFLALAARASGGRTTIDPALQAAALRIASSAGRLPDRATLALAIVELETGAIRALVGSRDPADPIDGQVNGCTALRSPGSALKPFIYLAAFEQHRLRPDSIVQDVPISRAGWSPGNYDRKFRGPMTAADALRDSRNVPAILLLEAIGIQDCARTMVSAGLSLSRDQVSRAGLALAVGGAEVTLLDLVEAYATIGRGGRHIPNRLFEDEAITPTPVFVPASCAAIDAILSTHHRHPRGTEAAPELPWFMWKTGTSSGKRDAWAVGHNSRYAVGVWVGRFDGAGSGHFVGAEMAEPLLAALFLEPVLDSPTKEPGSEPVLSITREIQWPGFAGHSLRILEPGDGTIFVQTDGPVPVHLRANRGEVLHWFIDGMVVPGDMPSPPRIGIGTHEIRCIADDGAYHDVTITVIQDAMSMQQNHGPRRHYGVQGS